jgi:hypothetical protein
MPSSFGSCACNGCPLVDVPKNYPMSHETAQNLEAKLRRVSYFRYHGMWHGDRADRMENSLVAFIYDVPYFGACGVIPPLHLLNQYLRRGGGKGGMSPGATWEPFSLSPAEYEDLANAVRAVPPESLRDRARFAHVQFIFDPDFEGDPESYPVHAAPKRSDRFIPPDYNDYYVWSGAVCAKHRDRWHAELKRAGFTK